MTTTEQLSPETCGAAAAYPGAGETGRLHAGRLRFLPTSGESVGVQAPIAGAVAAAAIVADVAGGGTAASGGPGLASGGTDGLQA